ncbi:hypothetical protein [Pseudochryseolinea flava]|uniref:Porin n=1 Tax=Pseudochryseolinea flava TaxID=2059302 RepID=A0A364XU58_9BACT|nr:hypothetical protein [Pseudochryseolinea flava]RAV97877.1 hypothetical protein DQQ10_26335 [Pseudochryseolinea flava]
MKKMYMISIMVLLSFTTIAQIDATLLKRVTQDTVAMKLNMDAVYNRPFLTMAKIPVALGGYVEANWQHLGTDGISEGHQFQMRRLTLFVASSIYKRIKFLSEIEFEDGTKEINIEFASVDIEFHPLFNLRGGIVMNPIGSFNQNHDGPKWEFIDRPISATQMLPATWSNVGFGVFGKLYRKEWVYAYEMYLTNGFDDQIVSNEENKTFLPASKKNPDRFEESFNGVPLVTAKVALGKRQVGEVGVSYMGGVYNKFQDDGLVIDKKRRVHVFALDFSTTLPFLSTWLNAEAAWVKVDVPNTYSQHYGRNQMGAFVDLVQPVFKGTVFGFERSVLNVALRTEYVDWNKSRFEETGTHIREDVLAVVPGLSWRPTAQTVIRLNYRYQWQTDLFGNPASKTAGFQIGFSSYF